MADCTRRTILILLLWISELKLISSSAPYCEFDLCNENEFCCKPNECCQKPNDSIYIKAWVLAGLLIIAIICSVLYQCKTRLYRFFSRGLESEALYPKV